MPNFEKILSRMFLREEWIDQAAKPFQKWINGLFQKGKTGTLLADIFNGTWLGHPLHPVLTDIPIGAWTVGITLDAMEAETGRRGIGKAADTAVAIGVAGAAGSAITGLADWQHTTGETRRTGFTHATLNTIALGLFIASLFQRSQRNRSAGRTLAVAGFAIAGLSAYLGGDMVYRQKMGVNHAPEEEDIEVADFVPVLPADQLPENRLTLAMHTNIPLVLLRRGDQVFALAETCAHLGGPLADGKLEDGPEGQPVVVCPWHGSQFDMRDGSVLHGPSAYPMPCFEARINPDTGQVEVRHRAAEAGGNGSNDSTAG